MKVIVTTRKDDGGVTVFYPAPEFIACMLGAGGYWSDHPRWFLDELVRRKSCPTLQRGKSITEDEAWRFIKAAQFGGIDEREMWECFKGHDCSRQNVSLIEIQDSQDLPDRRYRDAWRRSRNGGPAGVDLEAARPLQWKLARNAAMKADKDRQARLSDWRQAPAIDWLAIDRAIHQASDVDELKRVWPEGLPC